MVLAHTATFFKAAQVATFAKNLGIDGVRITRVSSASLLVECPSNIGISQEVANRIGHLFEKVQAAKVANIEAAERYRQALAAAQTARELLDSAEAESLVAKASLGFAQAVAERESIDAEGDAYASRADDRERLEDEIPF